jgi:hypothetical protein
MGFGGAGLLVEQDLDNAIKMHDGRSSEQIVGTRMLLIGDDRIISAQNE